MREIKFRGKRLDNGEWVYGYYVYYGWIDNQKHYIVPDYASALYAFEVDPSTVGQFTGILDKNEREIYEGDILKDTNNAIYYVDFIRGCFYLKTNYKSFPHLGWTEWLPMCEIDRLAIPVEFEIIGNIYENPELLSKSDEHFKY